MFVELALMIRIVLSGLGKRRAYLGHLTTLDAIQLSFLEQLPTASGVSTEGAAVL
jgi:hypothetical protein